MRLKIFISIILVGFFAFSGFVYAEDKDFSVSGSIKLGGRWVNENSSNSAKFLEYRDLEDGVFGKLKLDADIGSYFLNITGQNIGYDDQSIMLKGGKYGYFKYNLYYNEIIHNLSFNARTFYSGIGTGNLDYFATNRAKNTDTAYTPNIPTDANLWNKFDYSLQRKDVGASVDITLNSPFYVTVDANQLETSGVRPIGAPSGVFVDRIGTQTSAFGNQVELPAPVDYKTKNLNLEAGYNTKDVLFSISGLLSKFENANDYLRWRNPYVTTEAVYEVNSLAADSDYYKISVKGVLKRLPLDSALALNVGYARLKNDLSLLNTIASATSGTATTSPTYSTATLGLNDSTFNGDIRYKSASLALTSSPVKGLNTKLYYNYLKKDNKSDEITYTNGTSVTNELFEYKKNNFGIDVSCKLPAATKIMVGYEYMKVDRPVEREDAESTKDNSVYVELKNSSLDFLTAKIRYQRLWRSSEFGNNNAGTGVTDANYIKRFVRRFDATDKKMDALKLAFDVTPIEHFDIGLEYIYKKNNYDETILGRTQDKRNEYYVDASYEMPDLFKIGAFFDYETVKNDSYHRNFINNADVSTPPTSTNYNWSAKLEDKNYSYGVGLTIPVVKNTLKFATSWTYEKANGKADFASQNNYGTPLNIDQYDDYKKQAFNAKAVYKAAKNMDVTLGYAYESYKYQDAQYDGYQYVMNNTTSPNTYLTGAYANPNYNANIVYLTVAYKF